MISVLLVTRPASVQGTVSLAPSTTIPVLSTYTYLADGTKYKIIDAAGNGRSYIGPFCLAIEKSGSGSSAETKAYLESIEKDGGRIVAIEEDEEEPVVALSLSPLMFLLRVSVRLTFLYNVSIFSTNLF